MKTNGKNHAGGRLFFLAALAVLSGILFAGSGSMAAEKKEFIVGFDAEFPPYGYMDEMGSM